MTKETQKQRYETRKDKQQQYYIKDDVDGVKLKRVIEYMNAKKRIIKFDNKPSETIFLTGDIICFLNPWILLMPLYQYYQHHNYQKITISTWIFFLSG